MPEEHRVGTLNEDFAFESLAGDIFQLGNTSYRVLKVLTGKVFVEDARGQPPNMPFWLGEGLSRTDELSQSVARLTKEFSDRFGAGVDSARGWVESELSLDGAAAPQLFEYLAAARVALGTLPGPDTVIMERFFDEVGDTHLVIHSPFGARLNRGWGLALRKRFCRKFNFELQASALDDSIVLSFGPTHSFPLTDVIQYLKSATVRDLLVQALLDAPMFATRWRWDASIALAVQRMRNGKRLPPQFQRADAEDLLSLVFPDQLACAENLTGEREVPDHPLVTQTISDCLNETMDVVGLERLLGRIESGDLKVVCRDVAEPSPLANAILNARPYAFLDDGAAEERRTRSVSTRSIGELPAVPVFGGITGEAIDRVRDETWPSIEHADEMHDALVVFGFLTENELKTRATADAAPVDDFLAKLTADRRIARLDIKGGTPLYAAAERLHEFNAVVPAATAQAPIRASNESVPALEDALRDLVRSRLELLGPVTAAALAAPLGLPVSAVRIALAALEAEGAVMQGSFTAADAEEWCERRLLARMYRYSRDRRRAAVRTVPPAQFLRFLFRWQRIAGEDGKRAGDEGLLAAIRQLEGCVAPASAWEEELLPARVQKYQPSMLDKLCAAGRVVWHRPAKALGETARVAGPVRSTPILLCERPALAYWQAVADEPDAPTTVSARAERVVEDLRTHGASFASDLLQRTGLVRSELEAALGELVSRGLVNCDSFAGLRALTKPASTSNRHRRMRRPRLDALEDAGRWVLVPPVAAAVLMPGSLAAPRVEHIARVLLRRYGVVFRKLIERESGLPPWRELFYVYRRLEARGEVEGGRFVSGFSGEQFALPEAALALRKDIVADPVERVALNAVDPLNLIGTLTPDGKIPRLGANRVLFENGVPVAVYRSRATRQLAPAESGVAWERQTELVRKPRIRGHAEGAA
jgi:ATP-dependent Lhr-like helicase